MFKIRINDCGLNFTELTTSIFKNLQYTLKSKAVTDSFTPITYFPAACGRVEYLIEDKYEPGIASTSFLKIDTTFNEIAVYSTNYGHTGRHNIVITPIMISNLHSLRGTP